MLKSLISKLVGISSVVAITGSLAAGPANATVYGPSPYLNTCRVTGPRISTTTAGAGAGLGSGYRLAIRGTCFPAGEHVDVYFRTEEGPDWGPAGVGYDANLVAASDGTFTTPMVWRPPTTIQTTTNEYVTAYALRFSLVPDYTSNTLIFQVGGTITLH